MSKQRYISSEYKEFVATAEELATKEIPNKASAEWEDRFILHLTSMTKLFEVRFGKIEVGSTRGSYHTSKLVGFIIVILITGVIIGYFLSIALGGIFW